MQLGLNASTDFLVAQRILSSAARPTNFWVTRRPGRVRCNEWLGDNFKWTRKNYGPEASRKHAAKK
jgi:hypothetical protein